jgi:glutamine synthetase
MQIYKYVVHQVAQAYGKTATFMPKPIKGDNGSGMHTHQSIWKGKPLFAGDGYAGLSEMCLYLHRRRHQARQGAERLHQPDDQQLQAPGPGLRGAGAARLLGAQPLGLVPHSPTARSAEGKRVEVRFPDPMANPYLAYAAMLMAGLDGIENKIHPGPAMDKNLYDLPPEELKPRFRPSAARCAKRWTAWLPTTTSC